MTPRANLAHRITGRVRVRIPSMRKDNAYFQRVEQRLLEHDQIQQVEFNTLTGSVLYWHQGDLDPILDFAREQELFVVSGEADEPADTGAKEWKKQVQLALWDLDENLREVSEGSLDGRGLAFTGLVLAGMVQFLRGDILPKGVSLFRYAIKDVLEGSSRRS